MKTVSGKRNTSLNRDIGSRAVIRDFPQEKICWRGGARRGTSVVELADAVGKCFKEKQGHLTTALGGLPLGEGELKKKQGYLEKRKEGGIFRDIESLMTKANLKSP